MSSDLPAGIVEPQPAKKPSRHRRWLRRQFALWLANPFREGTQAEWGAAHDVPAETLSRWLRRPEVREVLNLSRDRWKAAMPVLAGAVARRVNLTGDPAAFKVLAEWAGDYKTESTTNAGAGWRELLEDVRKKTE